jgi:bacterioferritin-associated ferredoxin
VIVCHCTGATDRQIRAMAQHGADPRSEIARACKAGFDCGGCQLAVDRIVRECRGCEASAPELAPVFSSF